jgi:membrane protein implicated in regulation of membrane protease activity
MTMFLAAFRLFGLFGFDRPLDNNRFVQKVQLTQDFDEAIVTEAIAPHKNGQIHYLASWWLARCELDIIIPEGEIVLIVGRSNSTTFLVQPLHSVNPS